ncbi:MAG: tetratricopeptide repeat protein, partial [Pirellulaceae bacterium]
MIDRMLTEALQRHRAGDLDGAERLYRSVLATDPTQPDAWHLLGMIALAMGDPTAARQCIERAIFFSPDFADYHNNLATACSALGDLAAAVASCRTAIRLRPEFAEAYHNLGNALLGKGAAREALEAYRGAVQWRADYVLAWAGASAAHVQLGDWRAALSDSRRALELDADCVEAWNSQGEAYLAGAQFAAAEESFRAAAARRPQSVVVWYNLATSLQLQHRSSEAIDTYHRALALQPDHLGSLDGLQRILRAAGRWHDAEPWAHRALQQQPRDARRHNDWAELQWRLGRAAEAERGFRRAVELDPGLGAAHFNLGNLLREAAALDEAVVCYERALAINSDDASVMTNLAIVLFDQGRLAEAAAWFQQASRLRPLDPAAASHVLMCAQYQPGVSRRVLAEQHADWDRRFASPWCGWIPSGTTMRGAGARTWRVGFVSRDLRRHPVAFFLAGLFQERERDGWQFYGYSDSEIRDAWTARLQGSCDVWRETGTWSHDQLAEQIVEDGVDLLVDLAGHTARHRLLVFARRPAPRQATWMGYVGTTGLAAMDFLISDPFHTPVGWDADFRERILRLPDGYVCYTPPDGAPEPGPLPAMLNGFLTWGSFHHPAKISDEVIPVWSHLLASLPDSRLICKYQGLASEGARRHLRARFATHGIDPARLTFEGAESGDDMLRGYQRIDIALDAFPYSGGVTTCEALWMGVPVVTCPGTTFAGRHAFSHVRHAGLPDMVASSHSAYADLALAWASDWPRLAQLRQELR